MMLVLLWEGSARLSGQTGGLLAERHTVLESSKNLVEMEGFKSLVSELETKWSKMMRTIWAMRSVTEVMYSERWDKWMTFDEHVERK